MQCLYTSPNQFFYKSRALFIVSDECFSANPCHLCFIPLRSLQPNIADSFIFLFNINLPLALSFQPQLRFQRFLRSRDRRFEPYLLVHSFNVFLLFSALFLFVLVLLVSCMFVPMLVASRKELSLRAVKMKSCKSKS